MKSSKKTVAFTTLAFAAAAVATPAIVQVASNEAEAASTVKFTDVEKHWAKDMIYEAVQLGYVDGYVDGTFKPNNTVTNSEFIKMLTVAVNPSGDYTTQKGEVWYKPYVDEAIKLGLITNSEFPQMTANMKRSDLAKLGVRGLGIKNTDAKKWMYLATTNGLINGTDSKGTLKENGTMTRGEAVTVINRVLKAKSGEKLSVDKNAVANAEILWHKTNIFTMLPQWFRANTIDRFNQSNHTLTSSSPDGNIVSKANKLIVIDTDNPNDPNRHLLSGYYLNNQVTYKNDSALSIKGGYVIVGQNELQIKDTNKLTNYFGVVAAKFSVYIGDTSKNFDLIRPLVKLDAYGRAISANSLTFHKGQTQKHYEYLTGFYIPKNYPLKHMDSLSISFNGIVEWGNKDNGVLYEADHIVN